MIDVERWLAAGGVAILAAVVFAESGLLIGFFLPGDTLLFVAGFLSSNAGGRVLPALPVTAGVAFVAAAAGDQVGFIIGRRVGPGLFKRPQSRLFNPTNVIRAQSFFDRRGPSAVVVARLIPVVRTFTPIVAGVGNMRYRTFLAYNLIGAALWGVGVTTLGYYLGEIQLIKDNLDYAAIVILVVSLTPIALEYRRHRRAIARANI
ncbi:MAG TPA: VTT domain-containing protein [Ilumatobacteraceae bacterium]|mgnify:CR=1 FL=1|nr:VTT domain-containing protein [Ilumatobacteraceae bacterium]